MLGEQGVPHSVYERYYKLRFGVKLDNDPSNYKDDHNNDCEKNSV